MNQIIFRQEKSKYTDVIETHELSFGQSTPKFVVLNGQAILVKPNLMIKLPF